MDFVIVPKPVQASTLGKNPFNQAIALSCEDASHPFSAASRKFCQIGSREKLAQKRVTLVVQV
jgi:hypothetical protein